MMVSLFSIFDLSIYAGSLVWMLSLSVLPLAGLVSVYLVPDWPSIFIMGGVDKVSGELKILCNGGTLISFSFGWLLLCLVFANLSGLLPYIFTVCSHTSVSLPLGLGSWLAFMLLGWATSSGHMLKSLVPLGTPSGVLLKGVELDRSLSMLSILNSESQGGMSLLLNSGD